MLRHPAFLSKDGNSVTTRFIEKYPEVLQARLDAQNRGSKLLRFLSEIAVNGPDPALGATGPASVIAAPALPKTPLPRTEGAPGERCSSCSWWCSWWCSQEVRERLIVSYLARHTKGLTTHHCCARTSILFVVAAPPRAYLRDIYIKDGPAAFAAAVRAHKGAVSA